MRLMSCTAGERVLLRRPSILAWEGAMLRSGLSHDPATTKPEAASRFAWNFAAEAAA